MELAEPHCKVDVIVTPERKPRIHAERVTVDLENLSR